MQALQLFKTAGVWDDLKGYLDNDYIKYPAIGAGLGGLGMGAASAIGGPGEGVEEKPGEKRKRILGSAAKGMGFGGMAGLGAAGVKDWFSGDGGGEPEGKAKSDKIESGSFFEKSPVLTGTSYAGAGLGAAGGYGIGGREIANSDLKTDQFNNKANGIIENIKGQMSGSSSQEAIDALKKAYKTTNDPDILDQIEKLKGAAKPRSLDELLGRLNPVHSSHASIAAGVGAQSIGHATGNMPMPHEIDDGIMKMTGDGSADLSGSQGILKKLINPDGASGAGYENLRTEAKHYANNGFAEKPHLDFVGRSGKRIGWGLGGAAAGYTIPHAISAAGWALGGKPEKYTGPLSGKTPDVQ